MKKRETLREFVREQLHKQGVLLENIATQSRATIEAVQLSRAALEERIDRCDRESRERDGVLEAAIKATQVDVAGLKIDVAGLKTDVAGLKTDTAELKTDVTGLKGDVAGLRLDVRELKVGVQQNSVEIRELTARFAVVERLDERVSALERRAG